MCHQRERIQGFSYEPFLWALMLILVGSVLWAPIWYMVDDGHIVGILRVPDQSLLSANGLDDRKKLLQHSRGL